MNMSLSKLQEIVKNREAWHVVVYGVTKSRRTWLSNLTTTPEGSQQEVLASVWRAMEQEDVKTEFPGGATTPAWLPA